MTNDFGVPPYGEAWAYYALVPSALDALSAVLSTAR